LEDCTSHPRASRRHAGLRRPPVRCRIIDIEHVRPHAAGGTPASDVKLPVDDAAGAGIVTVRTGRKRGPRIRGRVISVELPKGHNIELAVDDSAYPAAVCPGHVGFSA